MHVQTVLPRDAIRSIDDPVFESSYFGAPEDEVLVVDLPGARARAYPVRILSHHEIVNDRVGDRSIAVTWCPICWSGAVYDRTVDGRALTFGVSGKLADDALVMYDRETDSEWKQPTEEAITGDLRGRRLDALAAPLVSWARFTEAHPDGVVLQPAQGGADTDQSPADRYGMAPYERYASGDEFGLYGMRGEGRRRTWDRTDLDAKTHVLGVERDGAAVGYPLPRVAAAGGVVTDTVGGQPLLVVVTDDAATVFEDPGFAVELREGALIGDGAEWSVVTGRSDDGRRLDLVPATRLFAFASQDAHGPDSFYGG